MTNIGPYTDANQFSDLCTHRDALRPIFSGVHRVIKTINVLKNWRHSVARPVKAQLDYSDY